MFPRNSVRSRSPCLFDLEDPIVAENQSCWAKTASTTLVSGEQIGARWLQKTKTDISNRPHLGGCGESEFILETHLGHKWWWRTRVVERKQLQQLWFPGSKLAQGASRRRKLSFPICLRWVDVEKLNLSWKPTLATNGGGAPELLSENSLNNSGFQGANWGKVA